MAALNRQQVTAAVLAGTAILGLCSCSPSPDPGPTSSGAPTIEQTVEPTVEATGEPTVAPTVVPDNVPAADQWSVDDSDYQFSDAPRGDAEQWLNDTYPALWAEGVRKVSASSTTVPLLYGKGSETPSALVQYIGGTSYDGTEKMPPGFRGQDPDVMPTDATDYLIGQYRDQGRLTGSQADVNVGAGGYGISIGEDQIENFISNEPDSDTTLTFVRQGYTGGPAVGAKRFGTAQEAFDWVLSSDFTPPGGDRALYPGEIASITVGIPIASGDSRLGIYDPSTSAVEWFD